MQQELYIYLAGTIRKGKEDEKELAWTKHEMDVLQHHLGNIKVVFLNPASRSDDLSDQKSVFGRDLFQVYSSHLILVDGREKRGLGVGAEMMFAKMNRIPVVIWLPSNTHYNRPNIHLLGQYVEAWIHPFVFSLSDYLAADLQQAARWIREEWLANQCSIKGPEALQSAMQHYLSTQLRRDQGMQEIVEGRIHFLQKMAQLENVSECFSA